MKKIFLIGTIIIIMVGILLFQNTPKYQSTQPTPSITQTTPFSEAKKIIKKQYNSISYSILYESLMNDSVVLIPNFDEKRTASQIAQINNCRFASSAGFYTENGKPLGQFKAGSIELTGPVHDTKLLTGYFSVFTDRTYSLTKETTTASTILQAGPLFEKNKIMSFARDEQARRILIIETTTGAFFLIAVYTSDNTYNGPKLADISSIIFSIDSPFKPIRFLNLDGGSASFFQTTEGYTLSELTPVGGLICVK